MSVRIVMTLIVNVRMKMLIFHHGMTMNANLTRKAIAVGSTIVIALTALIGIPIKAYIKLVNYKPHCVEVGPAVWTAYMAKKYAYGYIKMKYPTWNNSEWKALVKLWNAESHWNHKANNKDSTAYGIAQVLDTPIGTPAPLQIERGLAYIVHRYDRPSVAWAFHRKNGWY